MQHIVKYLEEQFYTPILEDIILIITLWIASKHGKKFRILRYMPLYAFFLLLSSVFISAGYIAEDLNFYPHFFLGIDNYIDYLFILVEMLVFSHFYYQIIESSTAKKMILIANGLFFGFFVYTAISEQYLYRDISHETQSIVYTVESIILLFPCFYYLIEFFKKQPVAALKNEPAFWVSTGILFFMACTLPYSLLENYISTNFPGFYLESYAIFHVFYILLFLMIIRAYLCKPKIVI